MLYIGQNGSMPMVKNWDSMARIFESMEVFRSWVSKILLARSWFGIWFWGCMGVRKARDGLPGCRAV